MSYSAFQKKKRSKNSCWPGYRAEGKKKQYWERFEYPKELQRI